MPTPAEPDLEPGTTSSARRVPGQVTMGHYFYQAVRLAGLDRSQRAVVNVSTSFPPDVWKGLEVYHSTTDRQPNAAGGAAAGRCTVWTSGGHAHIHQYCLVTLAGAGGPAELFLGVTSEPADGDAPVVDVDFELRIHLASPQDVGL